ncbi:expressed protein, partial [Aureococcus anophagefferens]
MARLALALAATAATTSALVAPTAKKTVSATALNYDPSDFSDVQALPGILDPVGFFDPANLAADAYGERAQALPRGRAHARPRGHARVRGLPRRRVRRDAPLRRQHRRHRHQPVLEGAHGLLARDPPLHRGARDVPRAPRLDGAHGPRELLRAPRGLHARRHRLRPPRPLPRGPGGVQDHADEGAPARPPRDARGRGHDRPGAPDGQHALLGAARPRRRIGSGGRPLPFVPSNLRLA